MQMIKLFSAISFGATILLLTACTTHPKPVADAAPPMKLNLDNRTTLQNYTGESFGYRAAQPAEPVPIVKAVAGQDDDDDYWQYLDHLKPNSWNLYGSSAAGDVGANGNPISVLNPPINQ